MNIKRRDCHENLFDLSLQSNEPEEHRRYMFLEAELLWLVKTYPESINLVSKFSSISREKKYYDAQTRRFAYVISEPNIYLKCTQSYIAWYGSKERLEVKAPGTVWHSWDNIKFVYDLKNNIYDLRVSLANSGRYIHVDIAAEAFQQLKRIMQGEDRLNAIAGLTQESLKRDVRIMQDFFLWSMEDKVVSAVETDNVMKSSYCRKTKIWKIGEQETFVDPDSNEGRLLSRYYQERKPLKKWLFVDELAEIIESPADLEIKTPEQLKSSVRNAKTGLNIKAKKIGFNGKAFIVGNKKMSLNQKLQ